MGEEFKKHIDILKTIPEIKKSIEELKFGSIVTYNYFGKIRTNTFIGISPNGRRQVIHRSIGCASTGRVTTFNKNNLISVMNPIHFGYLMTFLKENTGRYDIVIGQDGELYENNPKIFEDNFEPIIKLDNTKSYMEQGENFFKKLNDFLIKEFSLKLNK